MANIIGLSSRLFFIMPCILFFTADLYAANNMPSTFTYQGRLLNTGAPVTGTVDVYFEIYNPSKTCLLRSETHNITTTDGTFSIQVGELGGATAGALTSGAPHGLQNDPSYGALENIFENGKTFAVVAGACPAGYTAAATDGRVLTIKVWNSSILVTLGDQALTPVPQALWADNTKLFSGDNIAGFTRSWANDAARPSNAVHNVTLGYNRTRNIFEKYDTGYAGNWRPLSPSFTSAAITGTGVNSGDILKWNGSSWEPADPDATVTLAGDVTGAANANTVIKIQGNAVGAGVLAGGDAGKVLKWDGNSWEAAADDSALARSGTTTTNYIPKFINTAGVWTLTNSKMADNGTNIYVYSDLYMNGAGGVGDENQIKGLAAPTDPTDAATKDYVDNLVGGGAVISGTDNRIAMFNATGDNVENSLLEDDGTDINVLTGRSLNVADGKIKFGNALFIHKTGSGNSFLGLSSGNTSISGANNTAMGHSSLSGTTSGAGNAAFGGFTLSNNSTGSYNTAAGYYALNANTANGNTAFGFSTLGVNTSGTNNVAVGYTALSSNITGANNTAVGYQAGTSLTGSTNTLLGSGTATNATAASAGSVVIGYQAGPSSAGTNISNKLYIHNSASNTPLIYGDFSTTELTLNGGLTIDTAGKYLNYQPNGAECADGETLVWVDASNHWACGSGGGAGGVTTLEGVSGALDLKTTITSGTDTGPTFSAAGTDVTLNIPLASNATTTGGGLITKAHYDRIPASGSTAGQMLQWDGTNWIPTVQGLTGDGQFFYYSGDAAIIVKSPTMSGDGTMLAWDGTNQVYKKTDSPNDGGFLYWDSSLATWKKSATPATGQIVSYDSSLPVKWFAHYNSFLTRGNSSATALSIDNAGTASVTASHVVAGGNDLTDKDYVDAAAASGGGVTENNLTDKIIPMWDNTAEELIDSQIVDAGADGINFPNAKIQFNSTLFLSVTGTKNLFMGYSSGENVGGGEQNTGLGRGALMTLDAGSLNTAIGDSALKAVTTGNNNTALGASTLLANITGNDNIAIGESALLSSTASNSQLAIGSHALSANTSSGNLAIGYNAMKDNITGDYNTVIGNTAFKTPAGDSDYNVAIGYEALDGDAAATGDRNIAIGYQTLSSYTTANDNIIMGNQAGDAITTGSRNIAMGTDALGAVTTNSDSVAIGYNSLKVATISGNTGVGTNTLMETTTGNANAAFGYGAIQYNTGTGNTGVGYLSLNGVTATSSGGNNTAIGYYSLRALTTGTGNAILGHNTGKAITTGGSNVAVGKGAITLVTTTSNNTAIGTDALGGIVTGANNTALGYNAGLQPTVASSGNVFLGANAGPSGPGAISDKLYIDNTAGTPLIGGDFAADTLRFEGNVGIKGASNATYELDVNGDIEADAYYYSSDARLKENVITLNSPLAKILKLRAVEFDWIKNGKHEIGLIAQEIESVFPDLVNTDADGWKAVKYGNLVAPLIGATQEIYGMCKMSQTQITTLDTRLKNVERKIASVTNNDIKQNQEIEKLKEENLVLRREIEAIKRSLRK